MRNLNYAEAILMKSNNTNEIISWIGRVIYGRDESAWTEGEATYVLVADVEGKVNGDGFEAFLSYRTEEVVSQTLLALRRIKADQKANLLEKAHHIACDQNPPGIKEDKWDDFTNEQYRLLEELDKKWYQSEEAVYDLFVEYVKNNPRQFD